jgi:4'-phosphopantetheinyl transferase EntD
MRTACPVPTLADVSLHVADAASVPEHDAWLTEAERLWSSTRRVPKRRSDWRLGRWVGKGAVTLALGVSDLRHDQIEILPSEGGAPEPGFLSGAGRTRVTLSLSHSEGVGFAAALLGEAYLGCDVEAIAPRSEAFVSDYFTPAEAAWIREDPAERDVRATLLWSAKESALKALGEGLRLDTRTVEVSGTVPEADGAWAPVRVVRGGLAFAGWWRHTPGFVWSLLLEEKGRRG